MSNFNDSQLKELKDLFRQFIGEVEIVSDQKVGDKKLRWGLHTKDNQAIQIYDTGEIGVSANNAIILSAGSAADEETGRIWINCKNGDIHIKALSGKLCLEGTDVQINATGTDGQVTINAPRMILQKAPQITADGENVNLTSTNSLNLFGAFSTLHGEINVSVSEGVEEVLNGSLISKILSAFDEIKKFFG